MKNTENKEEKINCPICNGDVFTFLFKGKDCIYGEDEFNIVQCKNCSLIMTNPRTNEIEIVKYYPDNYGPYKLNIEKIKKYHRLKKRFNSFLNIIDTKGIVVPKIKDGSDVLEIGCGGGNFLYEYQLDNPSHKIIGIDFNGKILEELKKYGLKVFQSDLKKINIESNSIDLVVGWMVLEHVHCVNEALIEVGRVLKKNGYFCFSIPNANSWEFKLFRNKWYPLQIPIHLYHFTPNTITELLNKHNFKIDKIVYNRVLSDIFNSVTDLIKSSKINEKNKKLLVKIFQWNIFYFIITFPFAFLLSKLKKSGRITIIAKKYE